MVLTWRKKLCWLIFACWLYKWSGAGAGVIIRCRILIHLHKFPSPTLMKCSMARPDWPTDNFQRLNYRLSALLAMDNWTWTLSAARPRVHKINRLPHGINTKKYKNAMKRWQLVKLPPGRRDRSRPTDSNGHNASPPDQSSCLQSQMSLLSTFHHWVVKWRRTYV